MVFFLLGASLSHTDTAEQTPLVHAAKNGHRDTVIYLLGCQTGRDDRNSLDIDDDNIEQLVPGSRHALIAAAQNGHLDIVEYLLDTAELIVSLIKIACIICFVLKKKHKNKILIYLISD